MGDVFRNSLYEQDVNKFGELSRSVIQFNSLYNGNNIIQDDIFSVLTNYARRNKFALELLRFPTEDDDFCTLTCVKKGRIFVYINSWLPLADQIFAAAHELYHIWCFVEKKDTSVLRKGSFLDFAAMTEDVKSKEDQEANAFAGMLLVPSNALHEQMQVYGIAREKQTLEDIIRLMAIFSVPYKGILLRLYEEKYMKEDIVHNFLSIRKETLARAIRYMPDAARWQRRTPEVFQMGSLTQLMDHNQEYDLVADSRAAGDREMLSQILQRHKVF